MPLRKKFKKLKGQIKEKLGQKSDQAQSSTSLPSTPTVAQSSLSPNAQTQHHTLSELNVATTGTAPTQSTSGWVFLEGLAGAMSPVADAFGPLKAVFDELVGCVRIYEVRDVTNDIPLDQSYIRLIDGCQRPTRVWNA
jgi:hypothetical protein